MKIRRVLVGTLTVLVSNKLRSGLTILGIVIGVAAVIAMLSVGQGAQNSITSSISSIGTNLLFLSAGSGARFGGAGGGGTVTVRNVRPLTMSDAQALHFTGREYLRLGHQRAKHHNHRVWRAIRLLFHAR
jgi:putative ABC transport system permease protein